MGKNINGDRPTAFPLEQEKLPFTIPVVDEPRSKIAKLGAMITDRVPAKLKGTGKTFVSRFHTLDNRNCHIFFCKITINMQHLLCFRFCFFTSCMSRMTFLPQKFCRAEEQTGTHFPAHYICPLIT